MDTIVRKLDTAENHPRWWAYVASGEVLSANSAVVESYSNGMGCAILIKLWLLRLSWAIRYLIKWMILHLIY
ncbi:TPA: hypothetical protein ACX33I_002669 [Acinetobacter baumannii]